jgi:hypothetical protein
MSQVFAKLFTMERLGVVILWVATFSATFAYMRADINDLKVKYTALELRAERSANDLQQMTVLVGRIEERLKNMQYSLERLERKLDK